MKQLTEMTSAELTIVQKKINKDSGTIKSSIDRDIENLVTSLDAPLNFGKYEGKTLRKLIEIDPQYIVWVAENASERISLLTKD